MITLRHEISLSLKRPVAPELIVGLIDLVTTVMDPGTSHHILSAVQVMAYAFLIRRLSRKWVILSEQFLFDMAACDWQTGRVLTGRWTV